MVCDGNRGGGGGSCLFKHQSESGSGFIVSADCAVHAFLVEAGKGLGKRSKSLSCRQRDNSGMQCRKPSLLHDLSWVQVNAEGRAGSEPC